MDTGAADSAMGVCVRIKYNNPIRGLSSLPACQKHWVSYRSGYYDGLLFILGVNSRNTKQTPRRHLTCSQVCWQQRWTYFILMTTYSNSRDQLLSHFTEEETEVEVRKEWRQRSLGSLCLEAVLLPAPLSRLTFLEISLFTVVVWTPVWMAHVCEIGCKS